MSKKVLIVAFIYPPLGGSGVQRTLKFSKYLPAHGWQPYVVCSDDPDVFKDGLDASLVAEIPGEARVWRRRFVNPLGLRRWVQRMFGMKPAVHRNMVEVSNPAANDNERKGWGKRKRGSLQALASPLAAFEFPPVDAALYWALAIVPGCLRLIHQEKIDLIYTSSFPYSDHLTGYLIKRLCRLYSSGIPWVADFRDPWTQNSSARNTGWRYRVDQWVERKVLQNADRVIGVTPSYTADLRNLTPDRSPEIFLTIENGYDQADFTQITANCSPKVTDEQISPGRQEKKSIVLAHVGYLYNGTALPLFDALEELGMAGANLQVRFIGGWASREQSWLESHLLPTQILGIPRLPHAEAVRAMEEAAILLLFVIPGSLKSGHYPGKLFEYMASGRPILLVGQDGDAASLIEQSGTGCFVSQEDQKGLISMLRLLAEDPQAFYRLHYHPDPLVIAAYERRKLTSKLANAFNALIDSREE